MSGENGLPHGWVNTTIGEICGNGQYGWTTKAANQGTVKFLRTTDITKGNINWETVPYCSEAPEDMEKFKLEVNDILISRAGSVGFSKRIKEIPSATVFASYLIRFKPSSQVDPRYVSYFLGTNDYWQQISQASSGIALANVNAQKLAAVALPLAPLEEQKRIADKLERLLERVDKGLESLARVPEILKRFRQAVLAAATSGQLTREWRESNTDYRSGSALLNQVRIAHKAHNQKKMPEPVLNNGLFALPDTWVWASGAEIVSPGAEIVYGIVQPGPKLDEGIPYVRGMDIEEGKIQTLQLMKTSREIALRYARSALAEGDVLLGIIRATKVAIVPRELEGGNITQGTARFRPSQIIKTKYLAIALESPRIQTWLHSQYRGIDMPGLNLADVRRVPIPLPPIEEQEEISSRLKELFSFADALEARYKVALEQYERLTPTILAKAFRGDLVPQDPSDEPASLLLERIHSEMENQAIKPKQNILRRKPVVRKTVKESVLEVLEKMPKSRFSFDDLAVSVPGDYDTLKEAIFSLLREPDSRLSQVFDTDMKAMRFEWDKR